METAGFEGTSSMETFHIRGHIFTGDSRFWGHISMETYDIGDAYSIERADFLGTSSVEVETADFGGISSLEKAYLGGTSSLETPDFGCTILLGKANTGATLH